MFRVMIVDDFDVVRREIKRFKLWGDRTGFIVSCEASNGYDALEKLKTNQVDLVITDIKMPKINGIELLGKIKEKGLCPCVVLLSDYGEFNYARQGLVLGAFDYLTKPLDEQELEKLLSRVKGYISDKRKEQEWVQELEERLEEKIETFFPVIDVKQIIELIESGDLKVTEAASRIVDIADANLESDLIKIESVLKNAAMEIVRDVHEKYNNIDKFINIEDMKNPVFFKCDDIECIRNIFIEGINQLASTFRIIYPINNKSGVVSKVCNYILNNIDRDISLKSVAENLYMNRTYISEIFKQKTGITFIEYLTTVKIERAKKLLSDGNFKVYEISERIGYKDMEYFSRLFKKHTGVSVTEYRQNLISKLLT